MFTGIVESTASVTEAVEVQGGRRLTIDASALVESCLSGASIAVNGVCLTVCRSERGRLTFDVVAETLRRTNLGCLQAGHRVNLERSLRAGDRIDGHFVQGHVDGRAVLRKREDSAKEFLLWLEPQPDLRRYIIPKGAIALDGVSLTIAQLEGPLFAVALIPTTLQRTTLADLRVGDEVNVETDMMVRAVFHYLDGFELSRTAS